MPRHRQALHALWQRSNDSCPTKGWRHCLRRDGGTGGCVASLPNFFDRPYRTVNGRVDDVVIAAPKDGVLVLLRPPGTKPTKPFVLHAGVVSCLASAKPEPERHRYAPKRQRECTHHRFWWSMCRLVRCASLLHCHCRRGVSHLDAPGGGLLREYFDPTLPRDEKIPIGKILHHRCCGEVTAVQTRVELRVVAQPIKDVAVAVTQTHIAIPQS